MDKIIEYFSKKENLVGIVSILIVLIIVLFVNFILRSLDKNKKNSKLKFARARIINSIICIVVICIIVAIILKINGVDITAYVAGLGIVAIVVAFAIQDFLKDTTAGLFILLENYFKIGDVIQYDNEYCEVIDLSLKVTKLKNIETKDVFTVSNHLIEQAKVCSGIYLLVIPGAYDYDVNMMRETCNEIALKAKENKLILSCKFIGTNEFKESQIDYTLEVKVEPINIEITKRYINDLIQDVFKEKNLEIPFNQLDVHVKK